jgi:hypothetical protein
MAYGWPCDLNIPITQNFGANPSPNVQPDGHTGIDFGCPIGSNLYAIEDGTVEIADWADNALGPNNVFGVATTAWIGRSAGKTIILNHPDVFSLYGHCSEIYVKPGQAVKKGQLIGKSGDTGYTFGAHLHFEILPNGFIWQTQKYYGRANPLNYITKTIATVEPALTASQRVATSVVNYRPEPNTSKAWTKQFQPGDVLNFVGFVRGENVPENGKANNIWFRGTGGGYIHSSGVKGGANTTGLNDLTPAPPAPKPIPKPVTPPVIVVDPAERIVGSTPANQRSAPNTSTDENITAKLEPGFKFKAKGYVHGEKVGSSDIWLVGAVSGHYVHISTVTNQTVSGLNDITPVTPPKPPVYVPPVVTPPTTPKPPTAPVEPPVVIPALVAELACVTEVYPAHPDNYQVGNFPEKPTSAVPHQFGAKGSTLVGVKAWFGMSLEDRRKSKPEAGQSSAHFAVEDDKIVQFVSIKNRAYHAGKHGNNFIGIETSPNQSAKTIASVRKLIRELNDYYGYELIIGPLHKDIPENSTECGSLINLADYQGVGLTPNLDSTDKTIKEQLTALIEQFSSLIGKL